MVGFWGWDFKGGVFIYIGKSIGRFRYLVKVLFDFICRL